MYQAVNLVLQHEIFTLCVLMVTLGWVRSTNHDIDAEGQLVAQNLVQGFYALHHPAVLDDPCKFMPELNHEKSSS
jgi:hypothetical protein